VIDISDYEPGLMGMDIKNSTGSDYVRSIVQPVSSIFNNTYIRINLLILLQRIEVISLPMPYQSVDLTPVSLLIVDDEEDILDITKQYLMKNYSFLVDTAITGEQALSKIAENQYDAIVSDYEMEEMSGIDLLKSLRKQGNDTPFIVFTGKGREEVVIASFENGANGYVQKGGEISSQFAELADRINILIEKRRATATMQERERWFSDIYMNSPVAIELYDSNGLLIDVNPAACTLFGISSADAVREFRLFDDPNIPEHNLKQLMSGQSVRYETDFDFNQVKEKNLYKTSHSGTISLDILITPIFKTYSALSGYLVQVLDITERKQTEKILEEKEVYIRTVLDNIPIGISVNSILPGVEFTYFNDNFIKYYRTTAEALSKPDTFWETVYEDPVVRSELRDRVLSDCASGDPDRMIWEDIPITRKGEETTYINARNIPVPVENLMISMVWDVTDRKYAEQELRETNRLLEGVLNGIPDMIGIQNPDHTIVRYNKAGYEMLGLCPKDVSGKPCYSFIGKNEPCKKCATSLALKSKKIENIEKYVPELNRHLLCRSNPILDDNGNVQLVVEQLTDITSQKQLEESLRQSNQKLRFLTGLTRHDILNLIAAIHYYHELTLESPDPDTVKKYITRAHDAGKRIEATIGFTREYEEFGIARSSWQQMYRIIESAKREVDSDNILIENRISPSYEVYADPIIRKVFSTLLENSIRHGKTLSYIRFSAYQVKEDLVISCEDDGMGITLEIKESIFGRGFGNHTGIGLFLAREILSITGLSIRECGIEGEGARFEIVVPNGKWREVSGSIF
jgi:PAS domain S-box-containing protein